MTATPETQNSLALAAVETQPRPGRRLEIINVALFLVGLAIFFATRSQWEATGFLLGGLLNVMNLRLMTAIIGGFSGTKKTSRGKLIAQVVVKFVGVMGLLALIMLKVKPDPAPFLLGLSTVVLAVLIEGLIGLFRSES